MVDTTYNGWTNYETWAVGMYLDGNYTGEADYVYARYVVSQAASDYDLENVANGIWTEDEAKRYSVEDALKSHLDDVLFGEDGDAVQGIACDLLRAGFDNVNWRELAEHKLAEVTED